MTEITAADTDVPENRDATKCPYCGRPFGDARSRHLHVGEDHPEECTETEREAYEDADEAEREDLFVYHLKAVVTIGILWGAFVILYMVALGSNIF